MIVSKLQKSKKKQQGLALLVLVIVIFLTASSYYFSSVSMVKIKVDKIEKTQATLKRAKQALLDYAVVNWHLNGEAGQIGKLPCPDYEISGLPTEEEGDPDSQCGKAYANGIGYFPWRKLRIEETKDSSGSCLLYAVSPAYKTSPTAALNLDSYGQFKIVDSTGAIVQGALPEERPVVVIIAPESPLSGQTRESVPPTRVCGSYYSNNIADLIEAYLDNDGTTNNSAIDINTNNVINNFVAQYAGSDEGNNPLNDRLITITHKEFWEAMSGAVEPSVLNDRMEHLTEAIAVCFAAYGSSNTKNNLPMPAPLDLNGGEYRRNAAYSDNDTGFSGRLPYNVSQANSVIPVSNETNIFNNEFCNDLDLPQAGINAIHFKDDGGSDNGEYFDLWQNWKDHFFYSVSAHFKPGGEGATTLCNSDCVIVAGTEYAGIVFFSGLKLNGKQRYTHPFDGGLADQTIDPFNMDDKDDIVNYLEGNNVNDFPVFSGNPVTVIPPVDDGARTFEVDAGSNDIMFCIKTDMSVVPC